MKTQELEKPAAPAVMTVNSNAGLSIFSAIVIAIVVAIGVHDHDKRVMAKAAAQVTAAQKLADDWRTAARECSDGTKRIAAAAAAAEAEQHKRERAAIAAAARAARRDEDQALELEQASVPAGCGEAVQWGNIQAQELGHW